MSRRSSKRSSRGKSAKRSMQARRTMKKSAAAEIGRASCRERV